MKNSIISFVDFFYIKPLRFIPRHTFRYAAVGGLNVLLSMVLYWFLFNHVLFKQDTDFGIVVISAHILAFMMTFVITFLTGFYLTRNVAFGDSRLRGHVQLFRYSQVVAVNILINYFGLKLLVDIWGFFPSPSYAVLQVIIAIFSYFAQRNYTFHNRVKKSRETLG